MPNDIEQRQFVDRDGLEQFWSDVQLYLTRNYKELPSGMQFSRVYQSDGQLHVLVEPFGGSSAKRKAASRTSLDVYSKEEIQEIVTNNGTYLGQKTVEEVNDLEPSGLHNGDHVNVSDEGDLRNNDFPVTYTHVTAGDNAIYDGTLLKWDRIVGDYKTRQSAVTESFDEDQIVLDIAQNENGDLSVTKQRIPHAQVGQFGLTTLKAAIAANEADVDSAATPKAVRDAINALDTTAVSGMDAHLTIRDLVETDGVVSLVTQQVKVATQNLDDSAVTTAKIGDKQVTTGKLADGAVGADQIADGTITGAKIAQNTITGRNVATGNNNGITTANIVDHAITNQKLATDSVDTAQLVNGSVTTDKIYGSAVTTGKIADGNVTTAKIADGNVTTTKIADGNVTTEKLAGLSVTTSKIAEGNVTTAKIADSAVTTAKIADSSVTTAKIVDASVTHAKMAEDSVGTPNIIASSVTTVKIADKNVTTAKIADSAVTNAKMADNSVDTPNIVDESVTNAKIGAGAVTYDKVSRTDGHPFGIDISGNAATASDTEPDSALDNRISGIEDGIDSIDSRKADKVANAVAGNFASLDATGNIRDSGKNAASFMSALQEPYSASGTTVQTVTSVTQAATGEIGVTYSDIRTATTYVTGITQLKSDLVSQAHVLSNDETMSVTSLGVKSAIANLDVGDTAASNEFVTSVGVNDDRLVISRARPSVSSVSGLEDALALKADRDLDAVEGNLAVFDANGHPVDSGNAPSHYKTVQSAVSDPTASGSGLEYIATISQDANGVIAATKSTVQDATVSQKGVVQLKGTIDESDTDESKAATPKAVRDAINLLDVESAGGDGKYIKSISESDGKILPVVETADTNLSNPSSKLITSLAVDNAFKAMDATVTTTGSLLQLSVTQTDGILTSIDILNDKAEDSTNKAQSIDVNSTTDYPSSKAVADFVNSSISTNTANYISNNGEPFTSVAQLEAYAGPVTNNDYAFVTDTYNTYYDRYKATVDQSTTPATVTWAKEYRLNNSAFTSEQWAAINSTINGSKVSGYDAHLVNMSNPHQVTKSQVGLGMVNDSAITVTGTSVSARTHNSSTGEDETVTFNQYVHPETTAAVAAAVKVGRDAYGHVVLGTALAKGDVGLGNVDNTSDATKKSDFTGSIEENDTGFVLGGDAYDALETKANKSELSVTPGTGADSDKTIIQLKSGTSATVLTTHQDISQKADKVSGATSGNFASLDANGNIADSGSNASSFMNALSTAYSVSGSSTQTVTAVSQATTGEISVTFGDIQTGTTEQPGLVQLEDSTSSTSTTKAATPASVKSAYDLADSKYALPATGIPDTDLSDEVQASLALADGSIQGISLNGSSVNPDSSGVVNLGNLKTRQTAVADPTESGTTLTAIATLSQDANGVITATKKTIQSASDTQSGVMSPSDFSKLAGISEGATKTEASATNGNIVIDGTETTIYAHPAGSAPSVTGVPTADEAPGFGGTFKVNQVSTDATSHVSSITERTITIPSVTATGSADGLMSAADKTKLDGIAAGAEVNQNAFANVAVGETTVAAASKTDTLTFVAGSNVAITPDASEGTVTFAATDTTYTAGDGIKLENGVFKHTNSVSPGTVGATASTSGATFDIPYVTYDSQGHITATGVRSHSVGNASTSGAGVVQLAGSIGATVAEENGKAASEKAVRDALNSLLSSLTATVTSSDGTNLQVEVVETDGKITGIHITDGTASAAQGAKADTALQGVTVNGSSITPSSNIVDIPSATTTGYGVVTYTVRELDD